MQKLTRSQRLAQIEGVLLGTNLPMSSGELARACGMRLSPHFRDMLDDLKADEKIDNFHFGMKNGMTRYGWYHRQNEDAIVQLVIPF